MKERTRRAVALIAGPAVLRRAASAVYDYRMSQHFLFLLTFSRKDVSAYDFSERCHIGGSIDGLYHFGNRKHIQLSVQAGSFDGYDFDSRKHFQGTVSGGTVTTYDHETRQHHNYSI